MAKKRIIIAGTILSLGLAMVSFVLPAYAPAMAQHPALYLLDQLEPGRWELRIRDGGAGGDDTRESLCIKDGRKLIQLRHPSQLCQRIIVDDTADAVTIQYTCPGRGYGRTHIRRESGRLVQIETQGIANGAPFDFQAEARRFGECTP